MKKSTIKTFLLILLGVIISCFAVFVFLFFINNHTADSERVFHQDEFTTFTPVQGGTTHLGNHQYIVTQGDFTHLNDLPEKWSYGNPCGEDFFIEGWVYDDLLLKDDVTIYNGKLTVYGDVIYNGFNIFLECPNSELILEEILVLDDKNSDIFSYYPNPASDLINIKGSGLKSLDVYDTNAKTLMKMDLTTDFIQVHISEWESGLYFFTVRNDNGGSETKKIIKK